MLSWKETLSLKMIEGSTLVSPLKKNAIEHRFLFPIKIDYQA
jgi:hypothetical protein